MWRGISPRFYNGDIMRRDKNFKLAKQTKRLMASIVDPVKRNDFKNAMIEAQLASQAPIKSGKKNKEAAEE